MEPKFPEVKVQLTGEDGNVFAVIGAVSKALRRAGKAQEANDFSKAAMSCGSYDEVLQLCMKTVEVS